jgi:RNA polymerase sigma factor (sigma-70 family)
MIGTHHHQRAYIAAVDRERSANRRTGDLEGLVLAAASGDDDAWSAIVRRFTSFLSRIAGGYRVEPADIDDVVQTTFLRLYERIDTLRDPNALPGWLETTARHQSLGHIGRACRERPLEAEIMHSVPDDRQPEPDGLAPELSAELAAAVERLSARQRDVLGMLFTEDEPSYDAIAALLGMPIGSIGPTRRRALARLREEPRLARLAREHLAAEDDASSFARRASLAQ